MASIARWLELVIPGLSCHPVQQTQGTLMTLLGAAEHAKRWLIWYAVGLFLVVAFLSGQPLVALGMIVLAELFLYLMRSGIGLDQGALEVQPPAMLQTPIAILGWYELLTGCWGLIVGSFIITILFGVFTVVLWPHQLGPFNFAVLGIVGLWLASRPLWVGRLPKSLNAEAMKATIPRYLGSVTVLPDHLEIDVWSPALGVPQHRYAVSVGFAELDEVRMLDAPGAQAYWASMLQYDPSIGGRADRDVYRLVTGQTNTPTVLNLSVPGMTLLMRSSALLYLVGGADQFGPPAVVAWESWRAAHPAPVQPTA
jgi:hypothetical protein